MWNLRLASIWQSLWVNGILEELSIFVSILGQVTIMMVSYPINISFVDMRVHCTRESRRQAFCHIYFLKMLMGLKGCLTVCKETWCCWEVISSVKRIPEHRYGSLIYPMLQAISSCEKISFLLPSARQCSLFLFIKHHRLQVNNLSA